MARKSDYLSEVEKFIGDKIFQLRLSNGLTRKEFAEIIDVTHQQLHKYEKGQNRICAGRLMLVSKKFQTPITYFFDGFDDNTYEYAETDHQRLCVQISKNFMKIQDLKHQEAINELIKAFVDKVENTQTSEDLNNTIFENKVA
jgi:transcriptional regulator with XRE-family HTH domain